MRFDQHRRVQMLLAAPVAGVLIALAHQNALSPQQCALIGSGYLLGFIITPDLDLPHVAVHRLLRRTIPILGHALSLYLKLYARAVNTGRRPFVHRGISHYPILGTLTRALWLLAPVAVAAPDFTIAHLPHIALIILGLAIADLAHIAADGFRLR